MVSDAIILSGGFGIRLRDKISAVPKPMASVKGRPFLEYLFDYLESFGVCNVILSTGHLSKVIEDHFGENYRSIKIRYSIEKEPMGTGGAIMMALPKINSDKFMVFNGDTLFKADIKAMTEFHLQKSADITLALRNIKDISRYGKIRFDKDLRIVSFIEKESESGPGWINGGIYIINKAFLESIKLPEIFSFEKDFFSLYSGKIGLYGFKATGYFIDIGTPGDYDKANIEL
jgi:D-glycero-alpha-D-manno-heptose 1-phosphate guanylyltransferase